jgi:hypothetical protein
MKQLFLITKVGMAKKGQIKSTTQTLSHQIPIAYFKAITLGKGRELFSQRKHMNPNG